MRNIRLDLAYDGSAYVGWQIQPNGPTVQAAVERAIRKLTGESVSVLAAGRTDSGVHALGQVASFRTQSNIPADRYRFALQKYLRPDIVITASAEVDPKFHATFSAIQKRYRYVIHNSRTSLPFLSRYAYWFVQPLDVDAMQAAAQELVGTHDFRSFETQFPNKATSVRTIHECRLRRASGWPAWSRSLEQKTDIGSARDAEFVWFDIVADGFLYNMVRTIMGSLIRVGVGFWDQADVARILQAQSRSEAGNTAPACGLYLVSVDYPPELCRPPRENPNEKSSR